MANTVNGNRKGVSGSEPAQNAAVHGPHNRSTIKGVTLAENLSNAILNTQGASE